MTVESDAKFEEKLALGFKNHMTNLVNFNTNSGKSKNSIYKVSAKKLQKSSLSFDELSHQKNSLFV